MLWARNQQFCGAKLGPPELSSVCTLWSAQPLDWESFLLLQPVQAPPPSSRQQTAWGRSVGNLGTACPQRPLVAQGESGTEAHQLCFHGPFP